MAILAPEILDEYVTPLIHAIFHPVHVSTPQTAPTAQVTPCSQGFCNAACVGANKAKRHLKEGRSQDPKSRGIKQAYSPTKKPEHARNGCLRHFRDSITISHRKPSKPDYHTPRAYRHIGLLNTIGKTLDSVIATRLRWAAELLPKDRNITLKLDDFTSSQLSVYRGILQGSLLSPILYLI